MAILYVDLRHPVTCPSCRVQGTHMLFPRPAGYRYFCGECGYEERIVRDEDGRWHWMVNRLEDLPEARKAALVASSA